MKTSIEKKTLEYNSLLLCIGSKLPDSKERNNFIME